MARATGKAGAIALINLAAALAAVRRFMQAAEVGRKALRAARVAEASICEPSGTWPGRGTPPRTGLRTRGRVFLNDLDAAQQELDATGHLPLGNCGAVHDGGQFACTLARELDRAHIDQIRAMLDDDGTALSRPFTDAEECQADHAAAMSLRYSGLEPMQAHWDRAAGDTRPAGA